MLIVSIKHKGIAALVERGDASKIDSRLVSKLRIQLTFLASLESSDEFQALPFWKPHRLSDGRWSFHVTANYRLTFEIDNDAKEIRILDLEDYH